MNDIDTEAEDPALRRIFGDLGLYDQTPATRMGAHVLTKEDEIEFLNRIFEVLDDPVVRISVRKKNVDFILYKSPVDCVEYMEAVWTPLYDVIDYDSVTGAYWACLMMRRGRLGRMRTPEGVGEFETYFGGDDLCAAVWPAVQHRRQRNFDLLKIFKAFAPTRSVVVDGATGKPEAHQPSGICDIRFGPRALEIFRDHPNRILNHGITGRFVWIRPAEPSRRRRAGEG